MKFEEIRGAIYVILYVLALLVICYAMG